MTEGQIATKLKNELNKHGWFFKTTGVRQAGVPDIVGEYKEMFIGIEVKIHPNRLTELQQYTFLNVKNCYVVLYYPKTKAFRPESKFRLDFKKTVPEVIDWILSSVIR